jgi:hypothetical protein
MSNHPRKQQRILNEVCCASCSTSWEKHDRNITSFLLPCHEKHHLCPGCFSKVIAEKGCNFFFFCPCCQLNSSLNIRLTSWRVKYPIRSSSNQIRQHIQDHQLSQPKKDDFPIQYHHQSFLDKDRFASKKAVLSLSIANEKEDVLKVISSELFIDVKEVEEQSEEEKNKLQIIFSLFNPILVQSSKEQFCIATPSNSSNTSLHDIAKSDRTLLHQCLYALATGHPKDQMESTSASAVSQSLSSLVFACCDMLRHAKSRRRSPLKEFMGKQLLVNGAPQALFRTLNRLGISTCNQTIRLDSKLKLKEQFAAGFSFSNKRFNMLMVLYDNVGFRRRGGKKGGVGYDQYTALQIIDIEKSNLIKWGVYPDRRTDERGTGK